MPQRIVLVEDDADVCAILKKILTNAGYEVRMYPEGKCLLEPAFALPDLFILDNYMPTIDGIALCKFLKLQSHTKAIPVILTSGSHEIRERALQAGASAFLEKPFQSHDLLREVNGLLSQHPLLKRKAS